MTEAHVGRLLAACLHQAIGDVLPMRLEFYEVWLRSEGMRDGSIGLAPMSAVLGFLRTEPEYHEVVAHAGRLAARWTIDSMTPMQRRSIGWLPRQLRARAVLRIVAKLVRHICSSSRASTRIKRGHARLEITDSLFCTVREPQKAPMCDFHVAAVVTALEAFGLPAQATVERCLAVDGSACVIGVDLAAAGRWPLHRCLLIACIMLVPPISAFAQAAPGSRLLVMPFSASATAKAPGDAAATLWLGEAAAILLSEELQGLGVGALSRDERIAAFDRLQVPTPSKLTRATTIRVAELLEASEVVFGDVRLTDKLSVHVRMIRLDEGRQLPDVVDEAPLADIFPLFERLATALGRLTGRPLSPLRHAQEHPPLEAFENYVKGLIAVTPRAQQRFLELAFQQAPRNPSVLLAMWSVYSDEGMHDKALAAARNVPTASAASRQARFSASLSLIALNRLEEGFKELTALMTERASPAVANALGVVQLRRGGTSIVAAPALFQRAVETAPGNTDFLFNLGYAFALAHEPQPALLWLREAVRFNATTGDAHLVMSAVLQSTGKTVEAQRELDLAKLLGTKRDVSGTVLVDKVPTRLERLPDDVDGSSAVDIVGSPAQREQQEVAAFHLEQGRRFFAEQKDRDATNELRRAIYLVPYQDEPHLLLARLYQRGGRLTAAIEEFKVAIWCRETPAARVALGTALLESGDKAGARREGERALALRPDDASARDLVKKAGG